MSLNHRLEAYQNQLFDENDDYTGFQCPNNDPNCPIKRADGLEVQDAYALVSGKMEFAHNNDQRFCNTGTSYPWQGKVMCQNCHDTEHRNDPSASRFRRT